MILWAERVARGDCRAKHRGRDARCGRYTSRRRAALVSTCRLRRSCTRRPCARSGSSAPVASSIWPPPPPSSCWSTRPRASARRLWWRSGEPAPRRARPFAWISLDRGDNDPARLWWYVTHALRRACPEFGGEATSPEHPAQVRDIAGILLPSVINELARLSAPVVLVLDDYQVITEPSCHEQIAFLLQHLPASVQVVLITRTDPPLPLAGLRAAGDMAEMRAPELRFAAAEAALLIRAISGADLAEPDLAVLVERTEGWPVGLYLAALSLRGHPAPSAFVRQFTGDNRFIADFLAEEVLARQPAGIRQFLARTAILGRFCAPLCDEVVGSADAAEIIDTLERENLFIVPLDAIRQWFRYHSLFAQVLRGYLAKTEPDIVPVLHERAAPGIGGPGRWTRRSVTRSPPVIVPGVST